MGSDSSAAVLPDRVRIRRIIWSDTTGEPSMSRHEGEMTLGYGSPTPRVSTLILN